MHLRPATVPLSAPGCALALLALLTAFSTPLLAASASPAPPSAAAIDLPTVTAAYLLNFLRFTEWPVAKRPLVNAPYVIGVCGNPDLEDALVRLAADQQVHGHPLHVIHLKHPAAADDFGRLADCHLAYLEFPASRKVAPCLPEVLAAARGQAILTVSPASGFLADGGHVQLFLDGALLRFAIALDATRASGLGLHSRLLALARPAPLPPGDPLNP